MTERVSWIVVEHDPYPDFSWLDQDCYNPRSKEYEPTYWSEADMKAGRNPIDPDWYRDPANHVVLAMVAYDDEGNVLDSLGGIDFLADGGNKTGTFFRLSELDSCPYLRELAEEMGLSEPHIHFWSLSSERDAIERCACGAER